MKRYLTICIGLFLASLPVARDLRADSVMFMDESGNIIFVTSVKDVPEKYRAQVVAPTPTPYHDEKGYKEYVRHVQKQQRTVDRERMKEERVKAREKSRAEKQRAKLLKKEAKKRAKEKEQERPKNEEVGKIG